MDPIDLLLHPVRLRVVHAVSGGRTMTTSQLCARLPDVSKATMYRHVGLLAEAGILEVDGEQRVHGAVERRYRLHRARAAVTPDMVATASRDEYRRAFAVAMAALLAEFNAYLDRDDADPAADAVGFRQHAVWLSGAEREAMIGAMRAAIVPLLGNEPAADRTQHLLSPILFPVGGMDPRVEEVPEGQVDGGGVADSYADAGIGADIGAGTDVDGSSAERAEGR